MTIVVMKLVDSIRIGHPSRAYYIYSHAVELVFSYWQQLLQCCLSTHSIIGKIFYARPSDDMSIALQYIYIYADIVYFRRSINKFTINNYEYIIILYRLL
jgi:hypothetical protein